MKEVKRKCACKACQKFFIIKVHNQRYCNNSCKEQADLERRRATRPKLLKRKCVNPKCGTIFQPVTSRQKFCTDPCAMNFHNHKGSQGIIGSQRKCEKCGEKFVVTSDAKRYCDACRGGATAVTFLDKKPLPDDRVMEKYTALLLEKQELNNRMNTQQVKATIRIETKVPIGIVFWADWHDGGEGVDYEMLLKHMKLFRETPNLFIIGMGDYKDNYHSGAPHKDGGPTQLESKISYVDEHVRYIVKHSLNEDKNNWLGMIKGHHDDWDFGTRGTTMIQELAAMANCVNFWFGGYLKLFVNDIQYDIVARHSYTFESQLNLTNACKRMYENLMQGDIMALAHKHTPAIEELKKGGKEIMCVRSGGYKVWDEFAQKIAGWKGQYNMPIVVLGHEKKSMWGTKWTDQGIEYLNHMTGHKKFSKKIK